MARAPRVRAGERCECGWLLLIKPAHDARQPNENEYICRRMARLLDAACAPAAPSLFLAARCQ